MENLGKLLGYNVLIDLRVLHPSHARDKERLLKLAQSLFEKMRDKMEESTPHEDK